MIRKYLLEKWQGDFVKSEARFPAMVSAWGTGKSLSLILRAIHYSEKYKNNLGMICRRERTDLRDSTMNDFELYTGMKIGSDNEFDFQNGSKIMFRHAEQLQGNNLNNITLGFFGIEQAEEFDSADEVFEKLRGRLRRCHGCEKQMTNGILRCVCYQWGAVIANTNGHNWIYNLWKANKFPEHDLYEATAFENEHNLPIATINDWKRLEVESPKTYRRFVMNSWDDTDAVDLVIDPEWVRRAKGNFIYLNHPIRRIVTIDVARYGDDKTVFYALENSEDYGTKTIAKEMHEKKNTMEVVGRAVLFGNKHGIKSFAVDEIGVGSGVVDRLRELGHQVIAVNSSEASVSPDKYYNTRAEVYGSSADLFREGKVSLLPEDNQLSEQLSWAKYKVIKSSGLIQIEAKEDIKKRYGRSPDDADSFLNGLWAIKKVRPILNPAFSHEETNKAWKGNSYVPSHWDKRYEEAGAI